MFLVSRFSLASLRFLLRGSQVMPTLSVIQSSTCSTIHEFRSSLIYAATYLIHITVYLYTQSTIHVPNRPHIQSRIYPPITHPPIPLTDHTHTHTHTPSPSSRTPQSSTYHTPAPQPKRISHLAQSASQTPANHLKAKKLKAKNPHSSASSRLNALSLVERRSSAAEQLSRAGQI